MSLITLVITLVVIGVIMWAVNQYVPMEGNIKKLVNIVVAICVVVWLCTVFGLCGRTHDIRVPTIQDAR